MKVSIVVFEQEDDTNKISQSDNEKMSIQA